MTKRLRGISLKEVCVLLLMVALLVGAWLLVGGVSNAQSGAETEQVTNAVRNAALTCYAVEGAYPDSLAYLRQYYGLAYDENRYAVSYEAFASNQVPEIFVVVRGEMEP